MSRLAICLSTLPTLLVALPVSKADEPAVEQRRVRVIYLVSRDREVNADYEAAIEHAIEDLQKWYGKQLKGPTFVLSDPVVEVVRSNREAKWFYQNPNGRNQDNWGFYNTLEEAGRLVGAKHDDPNFVWVIYSDGPGNKGRGGNGVTCLPEDDLLGLVGKHPTQKNRLRWIAGLGHELGHAFGLPHPKDTQKHADAIMWTGIYGKYPDNTYLTEQDKKTLRRSPFFYHADGTPVFQLGRVVTRYPYQGGAFELREGKAPRIWTESKTTGPAVFTFEEARRDANSVFLRDEGRGFTIRIPLNGGQSALSTDDEETWKPLYVVGEPESAE